MLGYIIFAVEVVIVITLLGIFIKQKKIVVLILSAAPTSISLFSFLGSMQK